MMKFKVGIWYLYNHKDQQYYFKCNQKDTDTIHYGEFINTKNKEYSNSGGSFRNEYVTDIEISLEEIQPYLPEGHPDKKFILPKNWHINVTEENKEEVRKWSNIGVSTTDLCGIVKLFNPIRFETAYNTKGYIKEEGKYAYDFGQEITYNQFKKYVLNQPEENFSYLDKLLSKWNIK